MWEKAGLIVQMCGNYGINQNSERSKLGMELSWQSTCLAWIRPEFYTQLHINWLRWYIPILQYLEGRDRRRIKSFISSPPLAT